MTQYNSRCFAGLTALACLGVILLPGLAHAGGITEFAGPVEQVVATLRGPVGKSISVLMLILCGMGYWFSRGEEVSGLFKALLGVVVIITLISFSDTIINRMFTFSGAVL